MYPKAIRKEVPAEYNEGVSQCELSGKYGISRYAIQCWIGVIQEKNILSKKRGRKPAKTLQV